MEEKEVATESRSIETKNPSFVNLKVSEGNRLLGLLLQLVKPQSQCCRWCPVHVKAAYFNKTWNTEERVGAVRSQHAAITLMLNRHVRLIASVEEEEVESDKGKSSDLVLVGYWLKGRLMQTVLEVCLKLHYCYGWLAIHQPGRS